MPLIVRVCRRVASALGPENTYVATDDDRIRDVVIKAGYQCVMTSSDAMTGTDRVYEASQQIEADIFVNVQGDEPLIDPNDIHRVVQAKKDNPDVVINAMCKISVEEDPFSAKLPKPVVDRQNRLLYMSRAMVPASKDLTERLDGIEYYKQVCIYAFDRSELELFGSVVQKTELESSEDIEILRFLELGQTVQMLETSNVSVAVDFPEDVATAERLIAAEESTVRAIIWDFDGVILDSNDIREEGFRVALSNYPDSLVQTLLEYHRANGGLSRYHKFRYFYEELLGEIATDEQVQILADRFSSVARHLLCDPSRLISESCDFIRRNSSKSSFHIASGSDGEELRYLCERLQITQHFESIEGSPTPKNQIVASILKDNDYNKADVVLIGDSINDLQAAVVNGIRFWGFNNPSLAGCGERYISDFAQVESLVTEAGNSVPLRRSA